MNRPPSREALAASLVSRLLEVRNEHPDGMSFGGLWRPEGVTFREIARRDVDALLAEMDQLDALKEMKP